MSGVKTVVSGETVGVYVSSGEILQAWKAAAEKNEKSPSKYGLQAVVDRLRSEGFLPADDEEENLLDLIREARVLDVDVRQVLQTAMRKGAL